MITTHLLPLAAIVVALLGTLAMGMWTARRTGRRRDSSRATVTPPPSVDNLTDTAVAVIVEDAERDVAVIEEAATDPGSAAELARLRRGTR